MRKITFLLTAFFVAVGLMAQNYELVTDVASLAVGNKVVVVAAEYDYAISTTQNNNNRGQASVSKRENSVEITSEVQVLTLESGTTAGTWAFNTGSGYLYAASSSKNYLKTETNLSANSSWAISIADGIASVVAQGTSARNTMQYNQQSSLFACYGGATQQAIQLYKLVGGDTEEPTPDPEEPETPEVPADTAVVTIAEFLAAAEAENVWYELTGVMYDIYNTSYGNFHITVGVDSVLVYGLKENVTAGNQTFANLGLVEGDTLTLRGVRSAYNNIPQVKYAYYVSHKDYVPSEGEEPENPEEPDEPIVPDEPELPEGQLQYTFDFTVEGVYENAEVLSNVEGTNTSLAFAKNAGGTDPAWYTSGTAARLYGQNSLTISAKTGYVLASVQFVIGNKDIPTADNSTATNGVYDYETHIWTATGNPTEMVFTNTATKGHFRIQKVIVTYKTYTMAVYAPVLSVPFGEVLEAFDLTLTCATEGADIYYAIDGGADTKYEAPINIAKTTQLKVWAVKGVDRSDELIGSYIFPTEVADIAAFVADESGKNLRIASAVSVVAQVGNYLWIQDQSASMLVYGYNNPEFALGDQLTGLIGKLAEYGGAKQIAPVHFPTAVAGTPVEPTVMALADVAAENVHQYIKLVEVTYTDSLTLSHDGEDLAIYNKRFNYVYDGSEEDIVNVVAIVGLYNDAVQVYPISMERVQMDFPEDNTPVDNVVLVEMYVDGRRIVAEGDYQIFTIIGQDVTDQNGNLANGVYVVRTANSTTKVFVK